MASPARGRRTVVAVAVVVSFSVAVRAGGDQAVTRMVMGDPQASQVQTETEKGTGLITGQVVDAATSKPVARVVVSLGGTQTPSVQVMTANEMIVNTANPRQVLTDNQGQFLFRDLPKGRYNIRTTASGYLNGGVGQARPNGPSQTVELDASDSKVGNLTVRLWKSATLTGTVTDEAGEPLIGLSISAMRRTFVNGQPRMSSASTGATDDRGFYRLTGLIPGDYVVAVMTSQSTVPASTVDAYREAATSGVGMTNTELYRDLLSSGATMALNLGTGGFRVGEFVLSQGSMGRGGGMAIPPPVENQRVLIYPTTFYPSAASSRQATIVQLASGETRSDIDMQLKLTPTVRVSGMVTGPDGPAKNTGLRLLPADTETFAGSFLSIEGMSSVTDASGAFTFLGVTPGQYTLKVIRVPRPVAPASPSNMTTIEVAGPGGMMMMGMSMSGGPMAPPPPLPAEPAVWATQQVTVGDDDVTGVSVMLRSGARLSGRIQFEGVRTPPAPEQLQRAVVSLTSNEPRQSMVPVPLSRVEADGQFNTMGYAPGRYQVMANVPSMPTPNGPMGPSGWVFKSAVLNGRELTDDPLEIGSDDIAGIVITFTDRQTTLGGAVLDARGQPDKTAEIVIFPADSQGWKQGIPNPRRIRTGRSSLTGKYEFANVPVGDYYAVAVAGGSIGDIQDPRFLETLIPSATRVTVADGDRATRDLTSKQIR
jgi:protocatechuate 3,4-dioxygenase beta subunit